jgi:RND family efflux transporter MFP subunit
MKRNKIRSFSIITGSLLLIGLLSGCSSKKENTKEVSSVTDTLPGKQASFILQKGILSSTLTIPGELVSYQQVDLYAKVTSFVKKIYADVGSEVKQGQLLAMMEAPEISSQLAGGESKLQSYQALYDASAATYNRLLETSKTPGTISPNELELALAKKNSDLAQLNAAKAANREITDTKNYLEIRAPFDGVITARNVSAGAYVGPSGKGSEQPMFSLNQQNKLRLQAAIPSAYTSFLNIQAAINFTVNALAGIHFTARISRKSGALDDRLRAENIEMDVDNHDRKLLPGMVAEISIPMKSKDSAFIVPLTAVVNSTEKIFVIQKKHGIVRWVEVRKGREAYDSIEIFGNLESGDTIITKGSEEIRDGSTIR